MSQRPREPTNLDALERLWRRSPFHDEAIERVDAINKRVVIRLRSMTLVITDATDLRRCELPAVWLYDSLVRKGNGFVLDVETDTGHLVVTGGDVRLIRSSDFAVLIPPIDS